MRPSIKVVQGHHVLHQLEEALKTPPCYRPNHKLLSD